MNHDADTLHTVSLSSLSMVASGPGISSGMPTSGLLPPSRLPKPPVKAKPGPSVANAVAGASARASAISFSLVMLDSNWGEGNAAAS